MPLVPETKGSILLNIDRQRYLSNFLIPTELIEKIRGVEFGSVYELKESIDELLINYKFKDKFADTNIYAVGNETPFHAGLSTEKINFITYEINGKDAFKNLKQIVGYLCYFNDKIIGGKPKIGEITNDMGDEFFNISCYQCDKILDRHYGHRHMI